MTTPTQEQIEAAFVAFIEAAGVFPGHRKTAIEAALTAAAQVGELPKWWDIPASGADVMEWLLEELIAAQAVECATIERCAKVADKYLMPICWDQTTPTQTEIKLTQAEIDSFKKVVSRIQNTIRDEIAAAIRKLKETP